jgi:[ribosomal protein S5]-alanine N-acetyltransferase
LSELFDFSAFPLLETPRLLLRELSIDDTQAVFRIRSDYQVTRYNTGPAYERLEQAQDLIEAIRTGYADGTELRWGITLKPNPMVIGMCGFNYWVRHDCRASIGYDLAWAYWGQGIMSEAVGKMVDFGFQRMNLNRIEADADERNPASARVLEKIGFQLEGVQQEQFYEDGAFHNLRLFSLLRREYLPNGR